MRGVPRFIRLVAALCMTASAERAVGASTVPDAIFLGARVYTVDAKRPWAEAFAVRGGRFVAVGSERDIRRRSGARTRVVDLRGAFVMPGLVDAHVHPVGGGLKSLFECNFPFTATPEEIRRTVAACAQRIPAGEWIRGGQWDSGFFERHRIASPRAFLDAITDRHPVVLSDDSQHNGWANSAALRAMGIDETVVDPDGGRFLRDGSGQLTGVMLGNAFRQLFRPRLPAWTYEQVLEAAREANRLANGYGITAVKDANASVDGVKAYHELDRSGLLRMHVAASLTTPSGSRTTPLDYAALEATRDRYRSAHVHTAFVKLYVDGVPTPARTAAMLAPYAPDPNRPAGFAGETNFPADVLTRDVIELDRRGFTVKMHAAGDRSVRMALDAIGAARRANGRSGLRHELAHAGYVDPADIPRFAQLDAVADFSPTLWYPSPIVAAIIKAVGDRGRHYWPTRDLLDAGATLLVGSDWPAAVPDQNPWVGIESLVTRRDPRSEAPDRLWPEQSISLREALHLQTLGSARALRLEESIGSITVGKSADFVVLDANPFEVPIDTIGETRVRTTYFEGNPVYERPR